MKIHKMHWPYLLWIIAIICAIVAIALAYKAGGSGDVKSGTNGDPVRALALENEGMLFILLSSLFGAGAIFSINPSCHMLMGAFAYAIASCLVLWLVAMECEIHAVAACF